MFFFRSGEQKTRFVHEKIIVVGAGQVGFFVAKRLSLERKNVVLVDMDKEKLDSIEKQLDIQIVHGEVFSPAVLHSAGIESASAIVIATNSDEVNISTCLLSYVLNPSIEIIVRLRNEGVAKLYPEIQKMIPSLRAFINPEVSLVGSILRSFSLPGASEYAELAGGHVQIACFPLAECSLLNKDLATLSPIFKESSFMVAAINRGGRLIIPKGTTKLLKDDLVYFAFTEDAIDPLLAALGKEKLPIHNIIIVGGGNTGYRLAAELEKKEYSTIKLVEIDRQRAYFLADNLNTTLVIRGDATEETFLDALSPAETDVLVALTGDEETNLIACLIARTLGTKETVCRLDKRSYISLAHLVGIEHTITPRISAVNSILNCIRAGSVLSSISVGDDAAEALEFVVTEDMPIANKKIHDLALPEKCIILALLNKKETIIVTGDTVLTPQSRVLIMAELDAIASVEKLFSPGV